MNYIKQFIINTLYRRYILLIYGFIRKLVLYIIYPFKLLYKAIRQAYRSIKKKVKRYWKEILLVLFWLAGHFLISWGLAEIFGNIAYKFSYGLLFIGIGGYKFIIEILKNGFYILSE